MSKETSNKSAAGAENSVLARGVTHETPVNILPTARPDPKAGGVFVTVCSVEQNTLRCNVPHKNYDVLIRGTHGYTLHLPYTPEYGVTKVLEEDWNYIKERFGKHPSFANNRIFADKSEHEAESRAKDSETQELSKKTGTARLKEDDLASSEMKHDDKYGVSDAKAKKRN